MRNIRLFFAMQIEVVFQNWIFLRIIYGGFSKLEISVDGFRKLQKLV